MTNRQFRVTRAVLSDDSVAFNVIGEHSDGELRIGATDEASANRIAEALNEGAAWITAEIDRAEVAA